MKIFKIFKNVSLKVGLLLSAAGAFIALCTFNVILGLSDYDKTPTISLTLEALADGEAGGGSEIAVCLQIHSQITGKREKWKDSLNCYRDVQGEDTNDGKIIECVSSQSPSNRCNETSCRSITECYAATKPH
jgi:hypothetical protein